MPAVCSFSAALRASTSTAMRALTDGHDFNPASAALAGLGATGRVGNEDLLFLPALVALPAAMIGGCKPVEFPMRAGQRLEREFAHAGDFGQQAFGFIQQAQRAPVSCPPWLDQAVMMNLGKPCALPRLRKPWGCTHSAEPAGRSWCPPKNSGARLGEARTTQFRRLRRRRFPEKFTVNQVPHRYGQARARCALAGNAFS